MPEPARRKFFVEYEYRHNRFVACSDSACHSCCSDEWCWLHSSTAYRAEESDIRTVKKVCVVVLAMVLLMAIGLAGFLRWAPTFGAAGTGTRPARIVASDQFNGEVFRNLGPTAVSTDGAVDPDRSTLDFFFPPPGKRPAEPLPADAFAARTLVDGTAVWFGHSTFLLRTAGRAVLVDPVFFGASPVPFTVKAFAMTHQPSIDDLPPIDAVLISHDHYDHLDHKAVIALDSKVGQFLVPLGVGAHLQRWGIPAEKIVELDWYEHHDMEETRFTLTPARHFSGRGLTNRNSTLWGGWAIRSPEHNIFYSGDSGYFDEFAEIGRQLGPFDIAFMENGAYDPLWSEIHMTPEDSVRASVALGAAAFFPVHWAKFDLAYHVWDEPIRRAAKAAAERGVTVATPLIGEVFQLSNPPQRDWWSGVAN